jgi:hypothetical protein
MKALVEAIEQGKAIASGRDDDAITTLSLESYVEFRVIKLTDGEQHPNMLQPCSSRTSPSRRRGNREVLRLKRTEKAPRPRNDGACRHGSPELAAQYYWNLNRPVIMLRKKSGSEPPVGVVRETKSNNLPSFMP